MSNKEKEAIWERQPGESSQAYEAFAAYRDLGAERSITKVVQKLNKSRAIIGKWSSQWNWVDRARAWDNEITKQGKAAAVKRVKEMTGRHINIAMQLQKKALEALAALDLEAMSPKDIKEFIKTASELERSSRLEEVAIDSTTEDSAPNKSGSNFVESLRKVVGEVWADFEQPQKSEDGGDDDE